LSTADGPKVQVIYDRTGACNAPLALDGQKQGFSPPACAGTLRASGLVPTGGSTFALVLDCEGVVSLIPCDAKSDPICNPGT
jgi:hypothetical protein